MRNAVRSRLYLYTYLPEVDGAMLWHLMQAITTWVIMMAEVVKNHQLYPGWPDVLYLIPKSAPDAIVILPARDPTARGTGRNKWHISSCMNLHSY